MLSRLSFLKQRLSDTVFACAMLTAFLLSTSGAFAVNGEIRDGGRYTEEMGVCSFSPPEGWVLWDYYGMDVFSPSENRDVRLSLIAVEVPGDFLPPETLDEGTATDPNESSSPFLEKEVKGFENTFSEPDFELISLDERELEGRPGMEVYARATVDNLLFPDTIIHFVKYYTPTHIVTLTLRCPPAFVDEYRDMFETAVDSIYIELPSGETVSSP